MRAGRLYACTEQTRVRSTYESACDDLTPFGGQCFIHLILLLSSIMGSVLNVRRIRGKTHTGVKESR